MNVHEAKQERRRERYLARAEKKEREFEQLHARAREMASALPFGQPILVGHHSEQRDRNYRAKITHTFRRAFEALEYARQLRARADGVGRAGISSDDPDAVVKLHRQIEDAQRQRDNMKAANRALRMKDPVAGDIRLLELGYSEDRIRNLKTPDEFGATGFPRWRIANLSATIRRLKQRVARLEKQAADDTTTETIGDVKIIDNVEENRVQLEFPGKPPAEIRSLLKSNGFRWARSAGVWQRHRGNHALHAARTVAHHATKTPPADEAPFARA